MLFTGTDPHRNGLARAEGPKPSLGPRRTCDQDRHGSAVMDRIDRQNYVPLLAVAVGAGAGEGGATDSRRQPRIDRRQQEQPAHLHIHPSHSHLRPVLQNGCNRFSGLTPNLIRLGGSKRSGGAGAVFGRSQHTRRRTAVPPRAGLSATAPNRRGIGSGDWPFPFSSLSLQRHSDFGLGPHWQWCGQQWSRGPAGDSAPRNKRAFVPTRII